MARLLFGGGFFLFESIASGYTLTQGSAALPATMALTALGAAPLAWQLAQSIFPAEIEAPTESESV